MSKKDRKNSNKNRGESKELKYSEIVTIKKDITEEVKKEIKRWLGLKIGIIIFILVFFGLTSFSGIRRVQNQIINLATKDLTERINKVLEKENIIAITDSLIKENAENLIRERIDNEIKPYVIKIKEDQEEASKVVNELEKTVKEYSDIADLSELAIRAESGDRHAFEELKSITNSPNREHSDFAKRVISQIMAKYSSMMHEVTTFKPIVSDKDVTRCLNNGSTNIRKTAVYSIGQRKLYNQIPILISMIKTEEDLDVLATIFRTLNGLLSTNVEIFQQDAETIFLKAWNEKKRTLLK